MELLVFIERVLCGQAMEASWVTTAYALLWRARLQIKDSHFQIRSLGQLEDFVKYIEQTPPPQGPGAEGAEQEQGGEAGNNEGSDSSPVPLSLPPRGVGSNADEALIMQHRLRDVYTVTLGYSWDTIKLFADELYRLKMTRHALTLYEQIHSYDRVIRCLLSIKRRDDAEALIRKELKVRPKDPQLWCHLGEVCADLTHYETA